MIHQLVMKGYRGFERYALANLSRVNLLVGKNNSGKSSILEAVQLLADGGDLRTLDAIARRRGETSTVDPDRSSVSPLAEVAHFFHGHTLEWGASFTLSADGGLGMREFTIEAPGDDHREDLYKPPVDLGATYMGDLLIRVDGHGLSNASIDVPQVAFLTEEGALGLRRSLLRNRPPASHAKRTVTASQFVPPDSLDRPQLAELWDRVTIDGEEDDVVRAMQILEPDLTSIAFLSGERSSSSDPRGGVVVGFRGEPRRRPLGSYGEGMRRLLALAVALARTKDGVLLIDEVDTGLHYSILGDVWRLIVETAVRNNVQVFLTTHSLDCLRALAWFCGARPDLAGEVSVQKIERRLDEAVAFDASQIQIAIEQDIEVR